MADEEKKDVSTVDVDLDAIAPQVKKIKFGGQVITVNPPTTRQLLALVLLGQRNKEKYNNPEKFTLDDLDADLKAMKEEISNVIPELKDAVLSVSQIQALSELVIEGAMPGQLKELKKRGIQIDSPKVPAGL